MSTNPARRRWRNRLLLVGILPTVLVVLFAAKVGLMISAQSSGQAAYGRDDFAGAAEEFADNATLNLLEPWVSPFNEGASRHSDGDFEEALTAYDVALDDVPEEQECTVRINMALSHEAIGDAALEKPDATAAVKAWQSGRDVLAEGECPTQAVDERLRRKLEEQDQPEQEDPKKDGKEPDPTESERRKEQKEKLDKRNTEGREDRQQNREYEEYRDTPSTPEYHW